MTSYAKIIRDFDTFPKISCVQWATACAQGRYAPRDNLMLWVLPKGTHMAGVFTQSSMRSAAVLDCQKKLTTELNRIAVIVNSGNANVFTGKAGFEAVQKITTQVAVNLDVPSANVFSCSTGVIGEPLSINPIVASIPTLCDSLAESNIHQAAQAIRTTDTFAKGAALQAKITDYDVVNFVGIAKGSGMIAPNMATMLAFIATDAYVDQSVLQKSLKQANKTSFNAITVDGDCSTSDTVLLAATGYNGKSPIRSNDTPIAKAFTKALQSLMRDLAQQIVTDGEGATKFITVNILNANSDEDAEKIAKSIANSPLVKTAISGEDPNWGRVIMAIGKSGAAIDPNALKVFFGRHLIAENGARASCYDETQTAAYMRNKAIDITVDCGLRGQQDLYQCWSCDFSKAYVEINADYRS